MPSSRGDWLASQAPDVATASFRRTAPKQTLVESAGPDIPDGAGSNRSTPRMTRRCAMVSGERGRSLNVSDILSWIRRVTRLDLWRHSVRRHGAHAGGRSPQ